MRHALAARPWVPEPGEQLMRTVAGAVAARPVRATLAEIDRLVEENRRIHERDTLNLDPASNVMNPRAEALLSAGLGTRPSLGHPGAKYETGLEAIERIEVIAAELAAEVFSARYAEVRVGSGALANLYAFMATCRPGDTVIAPPAAVGGHVTHHAAGAAGRYGLRTVPAPVDARGCTVDPVALRALARRERPALITVGGSLNLFPHPVTALREIADEVGARVLFDAAHLCGPIAARVWPQPLAEGAHLMSMSTYKSLGGPAGGLVVTDDAELAERIDAIAHPGLTANFDAARTAALAVTLLDWKAAGRAYGKAMTATARRLAAELAALGVPVFAARRGGTRSHQFAVEAHRYGGGQRAARRLRAAGLLACGIGLPSGPTAGGEPDGLRLGTPEVARLGMGERDMPTLARLIARGLDEDVAPAAVAAEVAGWRAAFSGVHFTVDNPTAGEADTHG
ncbi:serine hydroxymethyltransferase [Streptomyces sp. WAC 06738]|uniref:serine hydroxymethyltransferase n=1 Tax=Streptomyces sp. WAC 06738 TaxID=2203210 RepID=UPI000F6B4B24|nr:aminotransferase class I/II-fold pyridoxal phosphate-dependent enzyme [Streptomyces sp. WAC 06738]AZM45146.1 serine hydroxymethyltransferase [Streptomyces sp. WAC 06738]